MDAESSYSVNEKERLRKIIADQVRRYLGSGGRITVVEQPDAEAAHFRGSSWHESHELTPSLDHG